MIGLELHISGNGSNRSANCATTATRFFSLFLKMSQTWLIFVYFCPFLNK